MSTTQELIELMRKYQLKIYSTEIDFALEREKDISKKTAFVKERQNYVNKLQGLERKNLERIATQMKYLDAEFENAIDELDRELADISNLVNILSNINRVSNVVSRIFTII